MFRVITELLTVVMLQWYQTANATKNLRETPHVLVAGRNATLSCPVTANSSTRWDFYRVNSSNFATIYNGNRATSDCVGRYHVTNSDAESRLFINNVAARDAGVYSCVSTATAKAISTIAVSVVESDPQCSINVGATTVITCTLCFTGKLADHVTCNRKHDGGQSAIKKDNRTESNGTCQFHRFSFDNKSNDNQLLTCNVVLISSNGTEHYNFNWSHSLLATKADGDQHSESRSSESRMYPKQTIIDLSGSSASRVVLFGAFGLLVLTVVLCLSALVYMRRKGPVKADRQQDMLLNPTTTASRQQPRTQPQTTDLSALYAQVKKPSGTRRTTATSTTTITTSSTSFTPSMYAEVVPRSQRCHSTVTSAAENNTNSATNPTYAEVAPRNQRHRLAATANNPTETHYFANQANVYADVIPRSRRNLFVSHVQSASPAATASIAMDAYAEVVPRSERLTATTKVETEDRQALKLAVCELVPDPSTSHAATLASDNGCESVSAYVPSMNVSVTPSKQTEIHTADNGWTDDVEEPIFETFVRVPVSRKAY